MSLDDLRRLAAGVRGERVLVTGATGNVGLPVALALAKDNEVWAAARFSTGRGTEELVAAGVHLARVDFISGDVAEIPDDVTVVVNLAVVETGDWNDDLDGNVNTVGSVLLRCREVKAFLHCSSTAVYQQEIGRRFAECDSLGDNHRVWARKETYSISKIAAEAMARFAARTYNVPITIARLNVPYGERIGGWPAQHLQRIQAGLPIEVHASGDNRFNLIHEDDIVALVPRLLGVAGIPPTTVNLGGRDAVDIRQWCQELGSLIGAEPSFHESESTIAGIHLDLSRMHGLVGSNEVDWRDGMRRLVDANGALAC